MTTNMEGVLLKWTNYLSGWQPRWFILDNGVLSYYKSQEDVNNGCKGSIKMAVCDIVVHPTDMTRLDLIIPGEQHYYVKASTPQDRQSWLIALGSSKASFSETSAAKKEADAMPDQMRTKKSELRLYCDLLMQQVHSIRQTVSTSDGNVDVEKLTESASLIGATCDTFIATLDDCMKIIANTPMFDAPHQHVRDSAIPSSPTRANVQRLPGTRSVITRPVEKPSKNRQSSISSQDSVRIHTSSSHHTGPERADSPTIHRPIHAQPSPHHPGSDQNSTIQPPSPAAPRSPISADHVNSQPTTPVVPRSSHSTAAAASSSSLSSAQPNSEAPSSPPNDVDRPLREVLNGLPTQHRAANGTAIERIQEQVSPLVLSSAASSEDLENLDDFKDAIDEPITTFFTGIAYSFSHIDTSQEDGILVHPFLEACKNIVPIFDKLNSTAFAPVKMDFSGNIRKIQQKQESNPEQFLTLQSMVLYEVQNNQHNNSNGATSALLWLKRSLEFIREFLREVMSDSTDLAVCAGNAYSRTLKNYHGWVVRGVFAVAVKALPYREVFISHLAVGDTSKIDTNSQHFEHALMSDIDSFVQHLNRVLVNISDFYEKHSLDSPGTV